MPRANLTLTIPNGIWIGDISRTHPDALFRILAAFPSDHAGVALTEVTAEELETILAEFADSEAVIELDILQRHDDTALIQFETTMPLLLLSAQGAGIPLEMPFRLIDGQIEWEVTAPQRRLSELGTQLESFGIPFTVNEIHQQIEAEQLLTDRQLQLLRAAAEHGYYDTPRRCSLTELADELGIAKSTCSETLHRAEEKIVKEFVENLGDGTPETETT
ncbi:helix-turn-helix domain-containing protein [Halomarina pelagica]|uniref:helix-turn-helix domain-containing protein n=1 Tax=Halomarina pelagica TaxID=2961599 RepID=UPI0020C3B1B1|nr:helix-turn-helix domain-containing protein [Halomarina sp. BND7]